jgi:uncharacterized protein (TIGR03118 family)
VSAAKQYPHRPGIAPALGLRAGRDDLFLVTQTGSQMENCTMAFPFSRTSQGQRQAGPRRRTIRLELERLEDRSLLSGYQQINLVGFQDGMAPHTDPNLNGWGMDFAPGGPFCVADTIPGVATFYDRSGQVLPQVVTIPAAPSHPLGLVGRPTGVVYNPTSDFVISEAGRSAPALFLFDARDGTISGWNPAVDPDHAIIMVDNSMEAPHPASYTGLVIAQNSDGHNILYAADFGRSNSNSNNRVDLFDGSFHPLGSFTDPNVAGQYPGYSAWQVEEVNGQLWVSFGTHTAPFGGVVDVFDTDGQLLTPNHVAANVGGAGPLENPWGIVQAPADFGAFSNDILIGNVEGAGNINAFDPVTGAFLGQLRHPNGTPIALAGLWDLTFGGDSPANGLDKQLYFDAGPNAPNPAGNGLFGRIIAAGRGDGRGGADPMAALASLAVNLGPASAGVASSPNAAVVTSGPSGAPTLPLAAQAAALPPASAPATSDQPMSRTGESTWSAGAVDDLFARLADRLGDVLRGC